VAQAGMKKIYVHFSTYRPIRTRTFFRVSFSQTQSSYVEIEKNGEKKLEQKRERKRRKRTSPEEKPVLGFHGKSELFFSRFSCVFLYESFVNNISFLEAKPRCAFSFPIHILTSSVIVLIRTNSVCKSKK